MGCVYVRRRVSVDTHDLNVWSPVGMNVLLTREYVSKS